MIHISEFKAKKILTIMTSYSKGINCLKKMCMKPNMTGKCIWLPAQAADQKLKQKAKTQYAVGVQENFVCYMTQHLREEELN